MSEPRVTMSSGADRVEQERGGHALRELGDADLRAVHGGVDVVTVSRGDRSRP